MPEEKEYQERRAEGCCISDKLWRSLARERSRTPERCHERFYGEPLEEPELEITSTRAKPGDRGYLQRIKSRK